MEIVFGTVNAMLAGAYCDDFGRAHNHVRIVDVVAIRTDRYGVRDGIRFDTL